MVWSIIALRVVEARYALVLLLRELNLSETTTVKYYVVLKSNLRFIIMNYFNKYLFLCYCIYYYFFQFLTNLIIVHCIQNIL